MVLASRILRLLLLLTFVVPIVSAAETIVGTYHTPGGYQWNGSFFTVYPCGLYTCDFDGDGADDVGIGGNAFTFDRPYSRLRVHVDDEVVEDSNVGYIINLWDGQDYHHHRCDREAFATSQATFREASIFVFAVMVTENLGFCMGSTGTLTVRAFD